MPETYRELEPSLGTHEPEPYRELRMQLGTHGPEHMPDASWAGPGISRGSFFRCAGLFCAGGGCGSTFGNKDLEDHL